jgi:hypothetical protein
MSTSGPQNWPEFNIGDVVECIDVGDPPGRTRIISLTKGNWYQVEGKYERNGETFIEICDDGKRITPYWSRRFILVEMSVPGVLKTTVTIEKSRPSRLIELEE